MEIKHSHPIRLHNVSKVYDTRFVETHALRGVSLEISRGEFVSISGPSGCGKSTLLSILGLLDSPSSGQYFIDGVDVSSLDFDGGAAIRNEKIGFVFQSFNLIDELSVFDNVALPLRYSSRSYSAKEIDAAVDAALETVSMQHRRQHLPNQLSGGQQQRVAIARAIVHSPSILLVDEPTGNLDSQSGDAVMSLLKSLNAKGTTICMVTHDPAYANEAAVKLKLHDGSIVQPRVLDIAV